MRRWVSSRAPDEVDRLARVGLDERRQRLAEEVVALQVGVAEGHDLGEEGVDPHEPAQRVAEPVLLVLAEGGEPVERRPEGAVQAAVVDVLGEQQVGEGAGLLGVEDPELVQRVPGVVEQVRVRGRRDGAGRGTARTPPRSPRRR